MRKGELVSYYVHEGSVEEVEEAMRDFGIEVDVSKRNGTLELLKFDPKIVDATAQTPAREILKGLYESKGKRTMTFISDNSLPAWTPERLLESERSHGRRREFPATFICAYPTNRICEIWNGQYFLEMLKVHEHAIFPGVAFPWSGLR